MFFIGRTALKNVYIDCSSTQKEVASCRRSDTGTLQYMNTKRMWKGRSEWKVVDNFIWRTMLVPEGKKEQITGKRGKGRWRA